MESYISGQSIIPLEELETFKKHKKSAFRSI